MIDKIGELTYKSINAYGANIKPTVDSLKFKQEYQGRIIDCMVGEVDDNYIETPETDANIVKLENSKEGLVKMPTIKGKTILVDGDGNETDTPREGCRLVSVGEEEDNKLIILSKNKNLFDMNSFKNSNNWITTGKTYRSFEIKLKSNTEYCFSRKDNSGLGLGAHILINTVAGGYDNSLGWIMHSDNANINNQKGKFITPNNGIVYLSFIPNGIDVILNTFKEFQIEEGNMPTDYTSHQSCKTEILLNEPLRSLPNGVCDEIVGNKLIRRIGRTIINGEQSFGVQSINSDGYILSDYSVTPKSKYFGTQYGLAKHPFGLSTRCTRVLKLTCERVEGYEPNTFLEAGKLFKKHYTDNPMEVLYELEEPIIEELPNSITLQGFDDTTMYIENSITPTVQYGYNALIPYKEELSKQQEEVNNNALDIEQNIIPYLMDMEFNLMLMEGE